MALKKFVPEEKLAAPNEPVLSVADEILAAIKLAKEQDQSSEVVVSLTKAKKLLKNLSYVFKEYKPLGKQAGILLSFPQKLEQGQRPKAQIYIHDEA